MRKTYIFLFIGLFLNASIFAQSGISGTVTVTDGAIKGVSVTASPGNKGTTTDALGNYSLSLNPGSYKITFSNTLYNTQVYALQVCIIPSRVRIANQ